jgi:outer membrane receptor for ferrienterochelin and colicin
MILLLNVSYYAAESGTIRGVVRDAQTKQPLPYANVALLKTGLGAASDVDGAYSIQKIPPGTYTVKASYIGYVSKEAKIEIKVGETVEYDFELTSTSIQSDSVVVTAQAEGQTKAINQQLSSVPIENVVSSAKLQELPDANAAESVGRLPGVSLIREGGEGAQVVIRGLAPQYNQITIDGVELPGNVASNSSSNQSSDIGDRATDLSMISSNMLGGIEVIKAITPDMDASVLGGVVNFDLRKAVKTPTGAPIFNFLAQGGYNQLQNNYSNYKFSGSIENRYFDDRFGVYAQAIVERIDLTSNELGADYYLNQKILGVKNPVYLSDINLHDVIRDRKRYDATIVLDYRLPQGKIDLMNFISSSDTKIQDRGESFDFQGNTKGFSGTDAKTKLNVITNLLDVKQSTSIFDFDLKLSHTYSENHDPEDLGFSFLQTGAGLNDLSYQSLNPKIAVTKANNNLASTYLDGLSNSSDFSRDRALTGSIDFSKTVNISDLISMKLKFGGMYQYRKRDYNFDLGNGSLYYSGSLVRQQIQDTYPWMNTVAPGAQLPITYFEDPNFNYGNFLNGDYHMNVPVNFGLMWNVLKIAEEYGSMDAYSYNSGASIINDYSGNEKKSAEYAMTTINIGENITFLPGVRYQLLNTTYSAPHGIETSNSKLSFEYRDSTISESHGYWLPMVHLVYKPVSWLQLHFAYTNTIDYPDYNTITPRIDVSAGSISYNNYQLKPAHSTNYDAVLSVYSNSIGLVTIDGFLKHISDLIFSSSEYVSNPANYPGIPPGTKIGTLISTYINNPYKVDLYGIELDWQTHLWYLPKVLSGLVLSANYTHIFSSAKYPLSVAVFNDVTYQTTYQETYYTSRIIDQPNDLFNFAIGYDYKGFSSRVSLIDKSDVFEQVNFWPELRGYSARYVRWDLSIKQDLPWYNVQVYFDINNLNDAKDENVNEGNNFPLSEQQYDMTANLGLKVKI